MIRHFCDVCGRPMTDHNVMPEKGGTLRLDMPTENDSAADMIAVNIGATPIYNDPKNAEAAEAQVCLPCVFTAIRDYAKLCNTAERAKPEDKSGD